MKKTTLKITVVFVWTLLMLNIFSGAFINVGSGVLIPDYEPIDVGPRIREAEFPLDINGVPNVVPPGHHSYYEVGDIIYWLVLDAFEGAYFFDVYQLRAIGTTAEIWVQFDLSWPEDDPRADPIVTDEQVAYLLEEFETKIYPTELEYFGVPNFHNGSDAVLDDILRSWGIPWPEDYWEESTGRNVILVSNIRDDNYYDYTYPFYIAGFYSGSFEFYFDRNIINIDSYNWEDRIGPDVRRPYLYESVIAHEYQHLIHDDYNPDDPSFMNEGMSMYAEIIMEYPVDWFAINSYLFTPDNSLIEWGDQGDLNILADYGAGLLWAVYLSDHFGGAEFLSYFLQNGIPGIEGINTALADFGFTETFDDVFHDWTIANLIHTDQVGQGRYNYVTLDLDSPEAIQARTYEINRPLVRPTSSADFGWTYTILGYNTLTYKLPAYGSDYVKFTNLKKQISPIFNFDGQDRAGAAWKREDVDGDGDLEWFSTSAVNLADISIIAEVDLSALETATLTFDTMFNIEPLWDFGFVQVSTDGGETWTSLEGNYTTTDHESQAHPDIVANLPGYTGDSEGWVSETMDLTSFISDHTLLRFRYMTDWFTLYPGWAVDNIVINGVLIDDADTTVVFASTPMPEVDWKVTLIGVAMDGFGLKYKIKTLKLNDVTETGSMPLSRFIKDGYVLLIMSPDQGWSDYVFSVTREWLALSKVFP